MRVRLWWNSAAQQGKTTNVAQKRVAKLNPDFERIKGQFLFPLKRRLYSMK